MAELVLLDAIRAVNEQAFNLLLGEFQIPSNVKEDCKMLRSIMLQIEFTVDKRRAEPNVREMMRSLEYPVDEAQDLLNKLKDVAVRRENATETVLQRDAWLFLPGGSALKDGIFVRFYGKKLNGVLKKIEAAYKEMNLIRLLEPSSETQEAVTDSASFVAEPTVLGRQEAVTDNASFVADPTVFGRQEAVTDSASFVAEPMVFGRSDDLKKIEAIVLSQAESNEVAVLPIVGMGGIGKTTVAQLVYHSEILREHFEVKRWVSVSDGFDDVPHVLKSIIDLGEDKLPMDNVELLRRMVREVLSDKRYLLVLDDLWDENPVEWDQLMLLLSCGRPGSTVIVTTSNEKVASVMATTSPYHLERLNEFDLWNIFKNHAFRGGDEQPRFVEIGKQMMERCGGLPIAAMVLGGILSSKKEEREWLNVLNNKNWFSMNGMDDIITVLKHSFVHLTSDMKACFKFCAVYPKNFVMERDTLIQLWMAHNYITYISKDMNMEDKGRNIFDELVSRSLFLLEEINTEQLFEPPMLVCKMHDLIYDLAQSLVGIECASSFNLDQQSGLPNETLHVSSSNTEDILGLFKNHSPESFHTILSLSDSYHTAGSTVQVDLSKANSCRALSLRNAPIEEIHIAPGKLTHLRYLDLSYCIWLKELPPTLCNLDLQTLKLSGCCHLEFLPNDMGRMRTLRHVYLDGCDDLKCMPEGLGQLTCLQTLTRYIVDPSIGCGIEELEDLNLGGLLELYNLENVSDEQNAKSAELVYKKNLIQLELWWADTSSLDPAVATDILEGFQPHYRLQVLKIGHYNGIQFSTWMHEPNMLENLTKLMLNDCRRCTTLPPFWHLPSLKVLHLWFLESLQYICHAHESALLALEDDQVSHMFPKLEFLYMVGMPKLECWQENDQAELTSLACPQLQSLVIKNCPNLKVLPSCPMLSYLEIKETKIPSSIIESFKNNGVDISHSSLVIPNRYT